MFLLRIGGDKADGEAGKRTTVYGLAIPRKLSETVLRFYPGLALQRRTGRPKGGHLPRCRREMSWKPRWNLL